MPSAWLGTSSQPGCRERGRPANGSIASSLNENCPCQNPNQRFEEKTPVSEETVAQVRREVLEPLKSRFVERGEVIALMALAVVAGEHLFLYGPPGTAKSALIRQFALAVRGRYFE